MTNQFAAPSGIDSPIVLIDDVGNNAATTTSLTLDMPFKAAIDYVGDVDWFRIDLTALTTYKFTLKGADAGGGTLPTGTAISLSKLGVWDPSTLSFLKQADLTLSTGPGFSLSIANTGTYYVAVSAPYVVGSYTLQANVLYQDDYTDAGDRATSKSFGSFRGVFESASDIDAFKYHLEAGKTYAFTLRTDDSVSYMSTLFLAPAANASTNDTTLYYDSVDPTANQRLLTLTPSVTGDYILDARSLNFLATSPIGYTVTATAVADDYVATTATTGKLAVGASVIGHAEVSGDRDWFAVNLDAGTSYTFSLNGGKHGTGSMTLYDATGHAISAPHSRGGDADLVTFKPAMSGTYYVQAGAWNDSNTAIMDDRYLLGLRVTIPDDYGNTLATAGQLMASAAVSGVISDSSDTDWFRISLQAGKAYVFKVEATPVPGLPGTAAATPFANVELLNGDGTWLNGGIHDDGNTTVTYTAIPTSGDYVLSINMVGGSTFSYKLTATAIDDVLPANAATTARIAPGEVLTSSIDFIGDVDWIRADLQKGVSYKFELTGERTSGGTLDLPALDIVDAQGQHTLNYTSYITTGGDPVLQVTPTADGAMYLAVHAAPGTSGTAGMGTYTLKAATSSIPFLDTTSPRVAALTAPVWLQDDPATGNITVQFSENISRASGAIQLRSAAGDIIETFNALTSNRITFNGKDTLTIDPTAPLKLGTDYRIDIGAGSAVDANGNASVAATYQFSTTPGPNHVTGTSGNDIFTNTAGSDTVDGSAGLDNMVYTSESFHYTVLKQQDGTLRVTGGSPLYATDVLTNVERVIFTDRAIAFDVDGNAGHAYRLYQAAFNRIPDYNGLGYWIAQIDKGMSLSAVAANFIGSTEFNKAMGETPTNASFVSALYLNTLHRQPDGGGLAYWEDMLTAGMSKADVLVSFSESAENIAALVGNVSNGISYTPYP